MGAAVGVVASVVMGGGAGGAMGGMMGGGMLGNLISGIFGGGSDSAGGIGKAIEGFAPANVINAVSNLVNGMGGNSVKDACKSLCQEHGMPKFIQDAVNKAVDEAMKKHQKPTEGGVQEAVGDAAKGDIDKQIAEMAKKIVELVLKQLGKDRAEAGAEAAGGKTPGGKAPGGAGATGGANPQGNGGASAQGPSGAGAAGGASAASGACAPGKTGGKASAMSWLQAIAKAMGDTLGAKASKLTELSQKVSDAADAQQAAGDDKQAQQSAAAEMTSAQTELNGVSQEFKLMTETFNSMLKNIGESMGSMARKQ